MEKIFKYPVKIQEEFIIEMPKIHKLLLVDLQKGNPFIWAMVDPTTVNIDVTFKIYGTGHDIDTKGDTLQFVGTFQQADGNLVWHLFKVIN